MKHEFHTTHHRRAHRDLRVLCAFFFCFLLSFCPLIQAEIGERDELPMGVSFTEAQLESLKPSPVLEKLVNEDAMSKTVATSDGLYFRLAKDRSLEKIAQAVRPVRLDSYLYSKFESLQKYIDTRFNQLETRLAGIEKSIADLKQMTAQLIAEKKELKA